MSRAVAALLSLPFCALCGFAFCGTVATRPLGAVPRRLWAVVLVGSVVAVWAVWGAL